VPGTLASYLEYLRGHGVRFGVAGDLWRLPDHDGPLVTGTEDVRPIELDGIPPFVEHRDVANGLCADHASGAVARTLLRAELIPQACRFWDVGCGTGVLATVAGLAGARVILASDVDPRVIALAKRTASEAGVNVQFLRGSLLEPYPPEARAEVVIANLPHKPVPRALGLVLAQDGGEDGAFVHTAFVDQAAPRFAPGTHVCFFLHSLPDPRLLRRYAEDFDLTLLGWKRRYLQPGEYGPLQDHFVERARRGDSFLVEEDGRRHLVAGVWKAVRR
jgi:release factor glutamine methyltransferase